MEDCFPAGTPVLLRNLALDRVRYIEPALVVTDTREERVLFRPAGTPLKVPRSATLRGDPDAQEHASRREYVDREWELVDATWNGTDVLITARPADWFSVWMLWEQPGRAFLSYYVNFEVPWTRTPSGFDTADLCLDLVVGPDLTMGWKDRDAFESRVSDGLISEEHAAEVRRAIDIVLGRIEARESPFAGGRLDWLPDPDWPIPAPDWGIID